jgi:hypothetical protein
MALLFLCGGFDFVRILAFWWGCFQILERAVGLRAWFCGFWGFGMVLAFGLGQANVYASFLPLLLGPATGLAALGLGYGRAAVAG